ncbi:MAG: universal stress protein [Roseivivax sp.]|nr:universal stress protein [Roseivivax sp.]
MFTNILLPIDPNHDASWRKALPMALELAGATGRVHVLGVVHDLGSAMLASYLPDGFERQALERMERDMEAFVAANVPASAKVSPEVGHGHVPEAILAKAGKLGCDLIVMASHPPDDLRTFLVGSYADKVVRHSEIPVLVVR